MAEQWTDPVAVLGIAVGTRSGAADHRVAAPACLADEWQDLTVVARALEQQAATP
jgi:hypothetical protein